MEIQCYGRNEANLLRFYETEGIVSRSYNSEPLVSVVRELICSHNTDVKRQSEV